MTEDDATNLWDCVTYLDGQGDLVSILIAPIVHILSPVSLPDPSTCQKELLSGICKLETIYSDKPTFSPAHRLVYRAT